MPSADCQCPNVRKAAYSARLDCSRQNLVSGRRCPSLSLRGFLPWPSWAALTPGLCAAPQLGHPCSAPVTPSSSQVPEMQGETPLTPPSRSTELPLQGWGWASVSPPLSSLPAPPGRVIPGSADVEGEGFSPRQRGASSLGGDSARGHCSGGRGFGGTGCQSPFPWLWGRSGQRLVARVAASWPAARCLTTFVPKSDVATSCSLPPQRPV